MITKLARQYVNLPWVAPTQRATPVFIHVVFQVHVTNWSHYVSLQQCLCHQTFQDGDLPWGDPVHKVASPTTGGDLKNYSLYFNRLSSVFNFSLIFNFLFSISSNFSYDMSDIKKVKKYQIYKVWDTQIKQIIIIKKN